MNFHHIEGLRVEFIGYLGELMQEIAPTADIITLQDTYHSFVALSQ